MQTLDSMERIEQNVTSLLMENEVLFKLLRYPGKNPLDQPITVEEILDMVTEQDDDGKTNQNCRLFWEPFTPSAVTEQQSQLRFYPVKIDTSRSVYDGKIYIACDIIVHQSISKINGGRRRNLILSEVLRSLNGQPITLMGDLRVAPMPISLYQFKEDYWGYMLQFSAGIAATGMGCP